MKTPSTWLRTVSLAAIGAAPLLTLSTPAQADTLTCRPRYEFCVEVDGKYPQDARFFSTSDAKRHMIDIPSQSVSYLIDMPGRKAVSIPRANVRTEGDGGLKVDTNGASNATSFALAIEGPMIRFDTNGETNGGLVRVMKALDRPPVIGAIGLDALLADRMDYREAMKRYTPDAVAMDAIKAWKKPMEIEAYFGTWCPHCQMYMPKILRVLKDASNPNIKVTLVGVPKTFAIDKGPWEGKVPQGIPVIIVKSAGKEVTHLGIHEGAVPEVELAGLMSALK